MTKKRLTILLGFLLMLSSGTTAQQKSNEKYPSLLWEITGNGLTKPSYLFGTMHVSSKLVFHLSDSFYNAIKKTDAVALELNPDVWQGQMVRLDKLKENYTSFTEPSGNDFITENTFRIKNYTNELKTALQTEPALVNNLLYRSYKAKEDFEEDTFLDLYIFQTGRKLGKKAAGVENYYEAEKIILEAYADMAKEKKKKDKDLDADFVSGYVEKIQDAYRRGDLDLMDSLDNLTEQSAAFREKFLYKRNEIQANAIDSIIKNTSLFAGVGAAHLPGSRGVIELLRKKGYTLKPVKMADRNSLQKNSIDLLRVPVVFKKKYADDNFYSVDVPGDLYKIRKDFQNLDRRQYADMSNGSYYLVTRVKTHAAFLNQSENEVLKKVDSVLYENIPGRILSKKMISKNGYEGFDISSKTRRGDQQRYQIFVTPFEVIIFKMSGKENYVAGKEATQFFSSITLREKENKPVHFQPGQGGFAIKLPQVPDEYFNTTTADGRWEYEAVDKTTGDAYLVFKKSIYNVSFADEDSFDLGLVEESFRSPDYFDKQVNRHQASLNGFPELDVTEILKDSSIIHARYFIQGPHYYIVARRTSASNRQPGEYLNSFSFRPYNYSRPQLYIDTFLRASVMTTVKPEIDESMRSLIEQGMDAITNGNNYNGYISYWQKPKSGTFTNDSTGETIMVQTQEFPKYFYIQDSSKYLDNEISTLLNRNDMYLSGKVNYINEGGFSGVNFTLRDTGSSRTVNHLLLIRNNFKYRVSTVADTVNGSSESGKMFFSSFRPVQPETSKNVYDNKLPLFFSDLFSTDSALQKKAQQALSNIRYGINGIPLIMNAIKRLSVNDNDYYNTKSKLIAELGYINDSTSDILVTHLKNIYEETADTSLFQNEVIKALAKLKTKASFLQLKEYFLQDPPIFENNYDYNSVFNSLSDTMKLSALLFPELLQLATLDDYKEKITELLVNAVDSGYITGDAYRNYFPSVYIDAIVALKKQKSKDEKQMQDDAKQAGNDDEPSRVYDYNEAGTDLYNYSILLMPYYDQNKNVQAFFTRLLQSKDNDVKLNTAVLMLRYDKPVTDSILVNLASNDRYCSTLYFNLERIRKTAKFPARYRNQLDIARSRLVKMNEYDKLDSIVYISKQPVTVKGKNGAVYFFKYRVKPTDQWRIGFSGLQPENNVDISTDFSIVSMTDVKLKENIPADQQFNTQLKKILSGFHKSGKNFYMGNYFYGDIKVVDDYED